MTAVLVNGNAVNGELSSSTDDENSQLDVDEPVDWMEDMIRQATEQFDYVRFTFGDIHGIPRSKVVPRNHLAGMIKSGVSAFAGTLCYGPRAQLVVTDEVKEVNFGNVSVKPMPDTLHALPWVTEGKYRVGELFCETFWLRPYREGLPQAACPRYVARNQLRRLGDLGYRLMSGYEAEFMVFNNDKPVFTGSDLANLVMAEFEPFVFAMNDKMSAAGIDVEALQTEYGDGQFEFATSPSYGIESGDQMFSLREAVKEMSVQHGYVATFMSKPFAGFVGNGQHFSHSLWSKVTGKNVFYDPADANGFSDVGRQWIGGLLKHAPALTALCCPTVNCYRRLHNPYAPGQNDWGYNNRLMMIRAKSDSPSGSYVENRLPSGSANPYVALAATVAAGIDGIVNRLPCPAATSCCSGGLNGFCSPVISKDSIKLPSSLSEALTALEADEVLCKALGEEFIRWFVTVKRDVEIAQVNQVNEDARKIEVERELYFKLI